MGLSEILAPQSLLVYHHIHHFPFKKSYFMGKSGKIPIFRHQLCSKKLARLIRSTSEDSFPWQLFGVKIRVPKNSEPH